MLEPMMLALRWCWRSGVAVMLRLMLYERTIHLRASGTLGRCGIHALLRWPTQAAAPLTPINDAALTLWQIGALVCSADASPRLIYCRLGACADGESDADDDATGFGCDNEGEASAGTVADEG